MRTIRFLVVSLFVLTFASHSFAVTGKLLAGTSKINITPKVSYPLHDSLYARALVLDVNGERLSFVSVDQGIFTNEKIEKIGKDSCGSPQLPSAGFQSADCSRRWTFT